MNNHRMNRLSESIWIFCIPLLLAVLLVSGGRVSQADTLPVQTIHGTTVPIPAQAASLVPLTGISKVDAGTVHTCAVTTEGGAICWGYNYNGQLGDGTKTARSTPVNVVGLGTFVTAISAGRYHTCALTVVGGVMCWGGNDYGQLGDGTKTSRSTPVYVEGLNFGVDAIAAGEEHTCAAMHTGGIKCWGNNFYGQLGDGTSVGKTVPTDVQYGSATLFAASITANLGSTCILTSGEGYIERGWAMCWGSINNNVYPAQIPGWANIIDISAGNQISGNYMVCALKPPTNSIPCASDDDNIPLFREESDATAIAVGGSHGCHLTTARGVKCWGNNHDGQLGDGTTNYGFDPVNVAGLGNGVAAISAGDMHTCAVTTPTGGVKCWGRNNYGQLGDSTTTDSSIPVDVMTESAIQSIYLPMLSRSSQPPTAISVRNGDFEAGADGSWTEYSRNGADLLTQASDLLVSPHSGNWAVWLGGLYDEISYIQQTVTVPASTPFLTYWQWIASEDDCGYDFGGVLVNGQVVDVYDLCATANTGGWSPHSVNLSAYTGTTVSVQIRAETDFSLNSNLFIDDVAFKANAMSASAHVGATSLGQATEKPATGSVTGAQTSPERVFPPTGTTKPNIR